MRAVETTVWIIDEVLAARGRAIAQRRLYIASARLCAIANENSNGNEGCSEKEIKDDGKVGEDADATNEAGQKNGESQVNDCSAADALDCFPLGSNWEVIVGEDGEEVGVKSENTGGTAECADVEKGLKQLQRRASQETHGFWLKVWPIGEASRCRRR